MSVELYQGDCIDLMNAIPDQSVDLVLVDPPYGTTACSWDSIIPLDPMWKQVNRVLKSTGLAVIMANEPFTSVLIVSNLTRFKFRWTWEKNKPTGFLNAKKQPLRVVEDVCVFYRKQPTYNPQKTIGHTPVNSFTKHTSDGTTMGKTVLGISGGGQTDRYPTNIIKNIAVMNNDGSHGYKFHPTQKPVELMKYLVSTHSNIGDTVLDFAMGSGTTGEAAISLGRKFIGIESDNEFFTKAKTRLESL